MYAGDSENSFVDRRQLYLRCCSECMPCPQALGYTLGKSLESGTLAKVKAAWSPFQNTMIAIKLVKKTEVTKIELEKFLPREIAVLQKISHPNILDIYQIVETDEKCFIAYELAENGTLMEYMNLRVRLPEQEARFIFCQLCEGLSYCHSLGISHRDLKMENIFFTTTMDIKIGDFGLALDSQHQISDTCCGSYSYCAPEVILGCQYNAIKADSWSLGVILYAMVSGRLPFGEDCQVQYGGYNYRNLHLDSHLSEDLRNVLRALLNVDAPLRPFITEVQTWKWVTAYPSTQPTWRENDAKYMVEKCLPSFLHTIETECLSQPNTLPQVNSNQHQVEEVVTLYPACEDQQVFAISEDKVAESASYDAVTVLHVDNEELEPNETSTSDDEESEFCFCHEIPTGELESAEFESIPPTQEVLFTSVPTHTSSISSSSARSLKHRFVASVRAKYGQFAAFMRRLRHHS